MANKLEHFFTWLLTGKYQELNENIILRCSRCKYKMKKVTKNKITIDVCPNCNGMFLDDGEIEKLLKVPPIKKTKTKKQSK